MATCVSLIVLISVSMGVVWPPTHASVNQAGEEPTAPVRVTAAIGVPTVAAAANARTGRCVTPSRGRVCAPQGSAGGAARRCVRRAPTAADANRNASANMAQTAITSPESAHAHQDTQEHFVKTSVRLDRMGCCARNDALARMEVCVTMLQENVPVLQGGWGWSVVSRVLRGVLVRTVSWSVSVIMEPHATPPLDNVSVAQDTQETGARSSAH